MEREHILSSSPSPAAVDRAASTSKVPVNEEPPATHTLFSAKLDDDGDGDRSCSLAHESQKPTKGRAGTKGGVGRMFDTLQASLQSWWWWELAAMILSLASIATVIIVLALWNGRPLGDWTMLIQPNSLIATLITISKTSMLVVIASCISQLKWQHYKTEPRRWNDLQYFDDASRGPWGSAALMWHTSDKTLIASIGAMITILALAMEPTAQQVIAFPAGQTVLGNVSAKLGVAVDYSPYLQVERDGLRTAETQFNFNLLVLQGAIGRAPVADFSCPPYADSCRWPSHTTLGICHECAPITNFSKRCGRRDVLQYGQRQALIYCDVIGSYPPPSAGGESRLAVNFTLAIDGDWDTMMITVIKTFSLRLHSTESIEGLGILNITISLRPEAYDGLISQAEVPLTVPSSVTDLCEWKWCEIDFEYSRFRGGLLTSQPAHTRTLLPTREFHQGNAWFPMWSANGSIREHIIYNAGFIDGGWSPLSAGEMETVSEVYGGRMAGPLELPIVNGKFPTVFKYRKLRHVAEGITESLNAQIRSQSMDNANATYLDGEVIIRESYIVVRWPWMILPVAECLLTAALPLTTVLKSKGQPLWKASAIALLYHGLEGWTNGELLKDDPKTVDAFSEASKEQMVFLGRNEEGFVKFMRKDGLSGEKRDSRARI